MDIKQTNIEAAIMNKVYSFFIKSQDFNGIPLRSISKELEIDYQFSIDLVKNLVASNSISIQSSTNPHVIRMRHFPIVSQLEILEQAKMHKEKVLKLGRVTITTESTEYPICLYPSREFLKANRNLIEFKNSDFSKQLALGEPQLKPIFFEIEVLERYFNDPRFDFKFKGYSGEITYKYDIDVEWSRKNGH